MDDIDWTKNPENQSTFNQPTKSKLFPLKVTEKRKSQHLWNISLKHVTTFEDKREPLLVSRLTIRDYHRGDFGLVNLISYLCYMTVYTEVMEYNKLMREVGKHTSLEPNDHASKLLDFLVNTKQKVSIFI